MGILNVTPDSFYDGGRYLGVDAALKRAEELIKEGADIIDVGGVSTRPGSLPPPEDEEKERVLPVIREIARRFPEILISVDTFRSNVAKMAIEEGAHIINDVTGGTADERLFQIAGEAGVPLIIMHMRGMPVNMQEHAIYENVVKEVLVEVMERVEKARDAGVCDIIIDPGFGFAKKPEHNWQLLKYLEVFVWSGLPLLVGISRKSMIYRVLGVTPQDALYGTIYANVVALLKSARIIRVHDPLPFSHILALMKMF